MKIELLKLAHARSGDKGDTANVGVIALRDEFYPLLVREKAAVIGHDWGATVAWSLAMKHPEYLWKLGALQVPPVAIWRKNQTLRQFLASWYMFFFQIPMLPEHLFKLN